MQYTNYTDELQHYGVLGMKWGVRRGNTAKAYVKASKKLTKLDSKIEKAQLKARKKMDKAERKENSMFSSEKAKSKAMSKAKRAEYKAKKRLTKASNWYKSMEKTFKNTDVKLTAEQTAKGKSYVDQLNRRTSMKSLTL